MSTTSHGLVSPDTPSGSPPAPEASTPPARPPANIPTFITPSAPPSIPPVWEHVIAVLMKLPSTTAEGQNLRSWVTALSHIAQHKHAITTQPIDFERHRPYFGWVNKNTIEKTFHKTPQWAVASTRYRMRKHFKSRFPAFSIPRDSEEVATDTIFSDTPAIDSGVTMAQSFVGKRTLVTDVYPLKSQKQFVNTLEDNIRFRGAMTKLISDYAKVEISNKVKDNLRMYHSFARPWLPMFPYGCSMVSLLTSASFSYTLSINQCFMPPTTNLTPLLVRRELQDGLALENM